MVAMGMRAVGGPLAEAAAELYREAAADQDEGLFEGVDLHSGGPGPGKSASGALAGRTGQRADRGGRRELGALDRGACRPDGCIEGLPRRGVADCGAD